MEATYKLLLRILRSFSLIDQWPTTVSHRSEYTPHIFVNILLYLFMWQHWRNDTHNIDTLGTIWTFSLRGVFTFVASSLDINGCVLSYFEGTANLHCYTSCTLTTLHCSKVSFIQSCHMKIYNKIFTKMWGVYSLLWDTVPICSHSVNFCVFANKSFVYWIMSGSFFNMKLRDR